MGEKSRKNEFIQNKENLKNARSKFLSFSVTHMSHSKGLFSVGEVIIIKLGVSVAL